MNIILEAFFDNNFGDDLFISTVLERYPKARFYVFWETLHPAVYDKVKGYEQLVVLPCNCRVMEELPFDGYIGIGGDVFMNWGDYTERIARMKAVKANGGFTALLGFNLYAEYSEKTMEDLRTMMELADIILPRDQTSVELLKKLVPDAEVACTADMAFTRRYDLTKTETGDVLGIAPRRKYMSTDSEHEAYCRSMAEIADGWLTNHPHGRVRFFAFSSGAFDDAAVSREIMGYMKSDASAQVITYEGDIHAFLEQFKNCTAMLPTRFHGLVFALIFKIPFVAVGYEVKLRQLLEDLNYKGLLLPYGQRLSADTVSRAVAELEIDGTDPAAMERYMEKADLFFRRTDAAMAEAAGRPALLQEPRPYVCDKMEQAYAELKVLKEAYAKRDQEAKLLEADKANITAYYEELLAKTKSFKGLAFLLAKKIIRLFIKEKV